MTMDSVLTFLDYYFYCTSVSALLTSRKQDILTRVAQSSETSAEMLFNFVIL